MINKPKISSKTKVRILLAIGIAYTLIFLSPFLLPEMQNGGMGVLIYFFIAIIFTGIIWWAVLYGVNSVEKKSTVRSLNLIGSFMFAGIPGVLLICAFFYNYWGLLGYGLIILSTGLLSGVVAIKKREFQFLPGAIGLTIAAIVYIFVINFIFRLW
jgi:hypothetical protein